ncbi:MAG TPA: hypothetical protein VIE43_13775 [Thermoanaerobaculia bacterium]|jgi:hypothetical protein|nr:hypothetical protein [Thermoanaerobaculia bacterium]
MTKFRFVSLAVVAMSLAASLSASAAPLPLFSQDDPMAAVFLASSHNSSPERVKSPLPTKCGSYCDTTEGGTTPPATAIGTSCTVAQTNLSSQLKSYANSVCGTLSCNFLVTTTVACHAASGGYSVTGTATFGCRDSTC